MTANKPFKVFEKAWAQWMAILAIIGGVSSGTIAYNDFKSDVEYVKTQAENMEQELIDNQIFKAELKSDITILQEHKTESKIMYEDLVRLSNRFNAALETIQNDSSDLNVIWDDVFYIKQHLGIE